MPHFTVRIDLVDPRGRRKALETHYQAADPDHACGLAEAEMDRKVAAGGCYRIRRLVSDDGAAVPASV